MNENQAPEQTKPNLLSRYEDAWKYYEQIKFSQYRAKGSKITVNTNLEAQFDAAVVTLAKELETKMSKSNNAHPNVDAIIQSTGKPELTQVMNALDEIKRYLEEINVLDLTKINPVLK